MLKLNRGLLVESSDLEKTVPTDDERTPSHQTLLKLHEESLFDCLFLPSIKRTELKRTLQDHQIHLSG